MLADRRIVRRRVDRSEHWLTPGRATFYAGAILAMSICAALFSIFFTANAELTTDKPLETDFIACWAASHLALSGHALDAYDMQKLLAAGREGMPSMRAGFAWFYLPTFYLVILPVAWLPYPLAYLSFMAATLAPFLAAIRQVVQPRRAWLYIAAFPGLWINLMTGQNGFLTAALAGCGLLLLPKRPVWAGIFIGLLAIKPHLAVLFPLALLADRNGLAFWMAGLTVILFMMLSTWLLGSATLEAAIQSIGTARHFLEAGQLPWRKMPSVFAYLQHLGVPVTLAYLAHAGFASVAAVCVWSVWRRSQDAWLRGAVLMTASLTVSPYLYDYDLVWLAFPIAWLSLAGLRDGWLPGEREILLTAWFTPLFMDSFAEHLNLQIGPAVLSALLYSIMRRFPRGLGMMEASVKTKPANP